MDVWTTADSATTHTTATTAGDDARMEGVDIDESARGMSSVQRLDPEKADLSSDDEAPKNTIGNVPLAW